MHNWTSLQLPATPLCRTRCVHNTPVKFITAAYASHYVAGHQRQVTWQRKPVTLAALRVMRHERVTQLRSAAIFAHGCPDEAWAETLVVVEGLSDRRAVWKAVPAQVCYITHEQLPQYISCMYHSSSFLSWLTEPPRNSHIMQDHSAYPGVRIARSQQEQRHSHSSAPQRPSCKLQSCHCSS